MPAPLADLRAFSPDRLTRSLRRWLPLIVLAGIAAGAVAFVASELLPRQYRGTAQLFLAPASNPTVAFQDVVLGQSLARSYVQLATADVVLEPAMRSVGGTNLNEFRDATQVAQIRDTSVITVSFTSPDPLLSASAANAVARSFIAQSRALQSSLQGGTVSQLQVQIDALEADIRTLDSQTSSLRAELSATPSPGQTPSTNRVEAQTQLVQLDSSRQAKQQTLAQLLKTRDDMSLAEARAENTVSLWQEAAPSDEPVAPRPLLNAALGAMAGVLVAVLVATALIYFEDRLEDLDELRRELGITPLGLVGMSDRPETLGGKVFVRDAPSSSEAEAFRALRTSIIFADVDRRPTRLLVTSALPGEGKSIVSANLAFAFAEAGSMTILVDADLRRPSQHRLFRVNARYGLTSLLTGQMDQSGLASLQVAPNLIVIPSGPLPPNPSELLGSQKMSSFLDALQEFCGGAGTIVLDTSPVLAVSDPMTLSTKVDCTLLVIDSSRTRTVAARSAIAALARVHARVLGAVLNKVAARGGSYYGYYPKQADESANPRADAHEV